MRDDLLDAYAAADWAITHLKGFNQRLKAWADSPPYSVVANSNPEIGKKFYKLRIDSPLPGTFNAEVGAIINTIRTSLDLLASTLARRNGKQPSAERHFPIYSSVYDFIDPLNAAKRKRWLANDARAIIEQLKPYRGGNDRLFALHHFDVIRKHVRLLETRLVPASLSFSASAHEHGLFVAPVWPNRLDNDGLENVLIGWADINAPDRQFQLTVDVTFNEGDLVANVPVGQALRDFWRMATMIIEMFE